MAFMTSVAITGTSLIPNDHFIISASECSLIACLSSTLYPCIQVHVNLKSNVCLDTVYTASYIYNGVHKEVRPLIDTYPVDYPNQPWARVSHDEQVFVAC